MIRRLWGWLNDETPKNKTWDRWSAEDMDDLWGPYSLGMYGDGVYDWDTEEEA